MLNKLKIAKQIPVSVLLKRVTKKILPFSKIDYKNKEFRKLTSTHKIYSLIRPDKFQNEYQQEIINHYLNHQYDLLGSGWMDRKVEKLHFSTHHQQVSETLIRLIPKKYQFINWQLDVKSGFQFDVSKQFNDQSYPSDLLVDVKNCWELGRLQFLPQLAIAAIHSENRNELILAFKNNILDFIASNPLGMGVQWACPMDVGIRVANMLIAYDIFKQVDKTDIIHNDFDQIFADSIFQHGQFIINHLESKEGAAGNHYLFNLVGLLFVTNYLSENATLKNWKGLAEKELEKELFKQFFNDGGNFEGSTTYHCLSSESMLYGIALILRNKGQIDNNVSRLIAKLMIFIKQVMKPDGDMPQFGDNDSGRLFKLSCKTNHSLNYEALLDGFYGLFNINNSSFHSNDRILVEQLTKQQYLNNFPDLEEGNTVNFDNKKLRDYQYKEASVINYEQVNLDEISYYNYPDFGIAVFKSNFFYLAISYISNKNMHHSWGHVHNDKLSFDLQVMGKNIIRDSGTYTYNGNPKERNEFRSTKAHHGIWVKDKEQNKPIDLFYLEREVECKILNKGKLKIAIQAKYYGVEHVREFVITEIQLTITDYCNMPFKVNINKFKKFSPNYGVQTSEFD